MGWIDFHTHILPGIDDGSRSTEMTREMLAEEQRQGAERIVATPHFYASRMSIEGFLNHREEAREKTEAIREEGMPSLVCGAEVYFFPGIGEAEAIGKLCIEGTNTILLEMPFEEWSDRTVRETEALLKRGFQILLAHIERYPEFQKRKDSWDRIMDLPLRKQINAGSFRKVGGWQGLTGGKRIRKFCLDTVRDHPGILLGSDCHNMTSRKPNMEAGREEILRELGEIALRRSDESAAEILRGSPEFGNAGKEHG